MKTGGMEIDSLEKGLLMGHLNKVHPILVWKLLIKNDAANMNFSNRIQKGDGLLELVRKGQ